MIAYYALLFCDFFIPAGEYKNTLLTKLSPLALIAHYRMAPAHQHDSTILIGCDICDAFNIVNGFKNARELEDHTKQVHGEVQNLIHLLCISCTY